MYGPKSLRIVVKMGGNVVRDPAQVAAIATELASLRDSGHQVCVVHGGGPQLDEALSALGEPDQKVDGLRVTSPRAAIVVEQVLDDLGHELAAALAGFGLPTHHLDVGERAFTGRVKDARLGRVGTVIAFVAGPEAWRGHVNVVTPVAYDGAGPLNLNADEGASAVAAWWKADWLVLATDVSAVRGEAGEALASLTPASAKALIGGAAKGGMIPKLQNAVDALAAGVARVLITRLEPGTIQDAVAGKAMRGTLVAEAVA
jgi:acetylglutamate kinase